MLIHPQAPFNFAQTLRFILAPPPLLNGRTFAPLLDYFVDGEYRRVLELGERLILYGVREEGSPGKPALRIRILAGPDDDRARQAVAEEVARQFSTDLDLQPFYALAKSDPVLRHLIVHFRGMRVPQAAQVYEILISAIIEQQVNLSFAHKVKKVLIDTYGRGVDFEGHRYSAFPEPAVLAITSPRELLPLQVSGPKARYIITISRLALDGTLDLEKLRDLEPAVAHEKLSRAERCGALDGAIRRIARTKASGLPARRGRGLAKSHPTLLRAAQAAIRRTCAKDSSGMARLAKLCHILSLAHLLGKRGMEKPRP